MNNRLRAVGGVACAFAALLLLPSGALAQVQVIISAGFAAAYEELLAEFERSSGITVSTSRGGSVGPGPNTIPSQIRRGVPADMVILAREGLDELIVEGRILRGTDVDLASSGIGVVVRAGAPKPDISTVEALRQTLLRARSVSVSTSTSGRYLTTDLFPRLGIASEMAAKTQTAGAAAVGSGDAELGLQQVSEVRFIPGTDFVGAIPDEVQYVTTYSAAVVAGATHADDARRLIAFLSSEGSAAVILSKGMEPAARR